MYSANPNIRKRPQPDSANNSRWQPDHHSNNASNHHRGKQNPITVKHQLYLFAASLTGLALWYLTPVSEYAVEFMLTQVPIEADMELSQQALRQQQFPPKIYHPYWTPQLESVGWQLVQSSTESTTKLYKWDFGIIQDASTVNAFALPGGVVRVTSGLLDQLHLSEGELAALVGHEMGHVVHRHSQARILQQQVLAYVFKALVYQDDDPHQENFGEALGELLLKSVDWLGQQSFSRANEYEADASSWNLLIDSRRYKPQSLQSLLKKLWEHHGRQGGKTSWESTHPGTLDRIEALDQKWKSLDFQERRKLSRNVIA